MYHHLHVVPFPRPALAGRPICPGGPDGIGSAFPMPGVELSPGGELGVKGIWVDLTVRIWNVPGFGSQRERSQDRADPGRGSFADQSNSHCDRPADSAVTNAGIPSRPSAPCTNA